eukprot:Seg1070.7 transcript_id=Seg1070.7/GoldUCD/mRNA.D3Y31 product="hypothetical protein" protein_id=Seg1070.7/GoldUCD/D3Y31
MAEADIDLSEAAINSKEEEDSQERSATKKPQKKGKQKMPKSKLKRKIEESNDEEDEGKSKKRRSTPVVLHNLKLLKTTAKTRAKRCEKCSTPFKENKEVKVKFHIGHYCDRPFFNKRTGQMHPGTRNYYFCVKRDCLQAAKQDITGDDIDIADVEGELTNNDCAEFSSNGIHIKANWYS